MKDIFLYLLRLGLYGEGKNFAPILLTEEEWISIYKMAADQTVEAIIYDGISLLPADQQPSKDFLTYWQQVVAKEELYNKQQLMVIIQLEYLFKSQHNLPFVVIKGQSLSSLYRNPLHRTGGDIDLWFGNHENQIRANEIIESLGIEVPKYNYDSSYLYNGIDVENHSFLIELNNPLIKQKIRELEENIFKNSKDRLDPVGNLLLQTTHILKHQLGNGIGLRQFCDLAVSIKNLEYDKEQFTKLCKEFGIYRWTQLLFAVITKYLGVSETELPFNAKGNAEMMMNEVLAAGNFGHADQRFGTRPDNGLKKKWHSLQIVLHKTKLFCYYIPSESFWRPYMLLTKGY